MKSPEADLSGWVCEPFTAEGFTYDVYRKGEGPGVVLIPEIPGAHPGVLALGNYLVDNGFTVAIPSLFGTPGAPARGAGLVPTMARACVAKEFAAFALNKERPVTRYLKALARDLKARTHGKGVGVIGQCFTGGFALAAAVDDRECAEHGENHQLQKLRSCVRELIGHRLAGVLGGPGSSAANRHEREGQSPGEGGDETAGVHGLTEFEADQCDRQGRQLRPDVAHPTPPSRPQHEQTTDQADRHTHEK